MSGRRKAATDGEQPQPYPCEFPGKTFLLRNKEAERKFGTWAGEFRIGRTATLSKVKPGGMEPYDWMRFWVVLANGALAACEGNGGVGPPIGGGPPPGGNGGSVIEIPKGAPSCLIGCTGVTGVGVGGPQGLAVDAFGNVWIASGFDSVSEIPKGATDCATDCTVITGGGINGPAMVAADPSGNIWVSNSGSNSVTEIPSGATSCNAGCINITGPVINFPESIVVDPSGNVWIGNALLPAPSPPTVPLGPGSVTEIPKGATSCSSACINFSGLPSLVLSGSRPTLRRTCGWRTSRPAAASLWEGSSSPPALINGLDGTACSNTIRGGAKGRV